MRIGRGRNDSKGSGDKVRAILSGSIGYSGGSSFASSAAASASRPTSRRKAT